MRQFNVVVLEGYLTQDPVLGSTPHGTMETKLTIANHRTYAVQGDPREEVHFFHAVIYGRKAEFVAEHCRRGTAVLVHGRLRQIRWETEDGQKRSRVDMVIENIELRGGAPLAARVTEEEAVGTGCDSSDA